MVRDGHTGDWIGTLVGHKGAVWSCRMDPSCHLIATASGDFHVKVWDAVTGHCIWTFSHAHIVKTCDFTPDSQWLATGGHEGIVRIYNLVQQEHIMMMTKTTNTTNKEVVVPMEIRPEPLRTEVDDGSTINHNKIIIIGKVNWYNNDIVLVGCSDGTVRIYNVRDYYNNHNHNKNPTSKTTTTTSTATPMHVIRTNEDGAEIRDMELTTIQTPPTSTSATTPSPPPEIILSIASGNQVYFYNVTHLSNHDTVSSSSSSSSSSPVLLLHQYTMSKIHFRNEGGISLHPYGHRFIVGGNDLYVYVYNFHTGMELECCKGHHGPIRCCRYSPNGTIFASGSEDGTIRLWQDP
jgi:serine-threonine kinase receptor-associated protein